MTDPIHIAGDGVAGLSLAHELQRRGARVVVHGNLHAHAPIYTLVHRYAGRSFRTTAFDDAVWHAASKWLDGLVERGLATRTKMLRPRASRAGDRLATSLSEADGVEIESHAPFGECFVYEPAFVVDVANALSALTDGVEHITGWAEVADVLCTGAALVARDTRIESFGGHLVQFDGALRHAISGGGVHAVPTADGICVGSTWWAVDDPLPDDQAVAQLRERACELGVELGEAQHVWRGTRAVYQPDRRPLVGRLGRHFVVGAFGTRGWYWAAYAAQQAADALLKNGSIAPELDAARAGRT